MADRDQVESLGQDARERMAASAPFRPSAHGLPFPNAFPGAPLPLRLPVPQNGTYGLCGGMAFAALDHLHAGQAVPQLERVPDKDSRFWRYLYRRQFDSFGPGFWYALKFALWTLLPDAAVQRRTRAALAGVKARLDAGAPVVLGIVYVGAPRSFAVWENHQVVAYRYEASAPGTTDLYIYDPNHPGDDTDFIRCVETGDGERVACTQRSAQRPERTVRGFFPVRYTPRKPPGATGSPPPDVQTPGSG